ncbi:hypothetical protein GUJ93_ZPchr0005g15428 [Zizania palustris]|uniref:WRKY domain-containing protein n=1 Tax=Zizania palustris TaxID=103762 RepID=A0A8J5W0H0_ZIZPA|nr:hypothetical protein GUJ93_ZPchr0005g15428 [Zizania palustris]
MSSSSMAPPPPLHVQVMENMERARGFAEQLQELLRESPEAGLIVDQILNSFSRAMRALNKVSAVTGGGEGSEVHSDVTCGGSAGGKRKSASGGAADRRPNCRRRTLQSSGETKILENLDDGQAWRKYGQKEIQNCKNPKAYFRCTHKYDQLCAAVRQVQRCDDDPTCYRVTYIGEHTCRHPAAVAVAPHVIHQAAADVDGLRAGSSRLISFAPADAATASTTTTAPAPAQPLKVEVGGVDQEEVLSSLTPRSSAARCCGGGGAAAGPDLQGDVTSSLHYTFSGDGGATEFFSYDEGVYDDLINDLLFGY